MRRKIVAAFAGCVGGGVFVAGTAGRALAEPASAAKTKKKVIAGGSPNYSRSIEYQGLLHVAGVIGVDPQTRALASPDFEPQCRQTLNNLKASVEAGGSTLAQALKCTCFLTEASDFDAMNKIYREFFPQDPPARSTVVVKELVLAGAKIEIDCIAHM